MYLQDTKPRGSIREVEGEIVSQTPITTTGKLTGFRICVGSEARTFTYQDPDPDVERVWQIVTGATHALVQYSEGPGKNPVLWGLAVNGEVLATPAQLEVARSSRYFLYVAGFALAVGAFIWAVYAGLRERKLHTASAVT
ncbi:MAG: hypothetical protein H6933_02685 [Burkholderiaceae bacterium]|nr:hypothetical protein [Burkholderiaceae bacterium]